MIHKCEICKLEYANAETAKQCYEWCSTHNSCNFLIASKAINKEEAKNKPIDDERFKN